MKNDVVNEIKKSLDFILEDDQVTELRALEVEVDGHKNTKTVTGYFNDHVKMSEHAAKITGHAKGVYFVPNPVDPNLLKKAENRITGAEIGESTANINIIKRNWLLIDCDPDRPSGTSSTDDEHECALVKARQIRDDLTAKGWPMPLIADSGNGAHLMYKIDVAKDDNDLLKNILLALAEKYEDKIIKMDTGVYNPARIWKLYGTFARKGENTPDRPHRQSKILRDETPEKLDIVPLDKLEELASERKTINLKEVKTFSGNSSFKIEEWIENHRSEFNKFGLSSAKEWNGSGKVWYFNVCPWNSEHTNRSAYIVKQASGAVGAGCHHNGCNDKDWHALRDVIEPDWREKSSNSFALTDYGNAERLADRHGNDIRYCYQQKQWYCWDQKRWVEDTTGEIQRKAKETVRAIYGEASKIKNDDKRSETVAWAIRSESENRIKAMIQLTESEPGIAVKADQFDANPWLLNCENGTLDLTTGELQSHNRDDMITKLIPVEWKGLDETHSVWEKLMDDSTGNNAELKDFLRRAAGYSLTGDISEEVLFFVHGPAASGKSTFLEALKATLGDYCSTADFEAFLKRQSVGGARNDIARLAGSRLVASIEVDEGKKLAEGLIKMLTGGDKVTARFLYRESFEFIPTFKLWLAANHAPRVNADDAAMWRRILRIPFDNVIPKEKRDPDIKKVLRNPDDAGSAILAWMVKGCLEWQQHGLSIPQCIEDATTELMQEMDTLGDFFDECCNITRPNSQSWESVSDLMKAYQQWASKNSERYTVGRRTFTEKLRSLGCLSIKKNGKRGYSGIELSEEVKSMLGYLPY